VAEMKLYVGLLVACSTADVLHAPGGAHGP
jgi:hypothetical protein